MVENLHSESYYLWRSLYPILLFVAASFVLYMAALCANICMKVYVLLQNDSGETGNKCCLAMNSIEKFARSASKTYLGAPLGLFNKDLSDNEELCINGQEISQLTLLMLASYVYFAVIAIITITWEIFIIDYSATCDDDFDCFLNVENNESIAITDCSIVNESSTVDCYRSAHNANALAAAGGLITIFKVIPLITSAILLKFYYYCAILIEKCSGESLNKISFFKCINDFMDTHRLTLIVLFFSVFWFIFIISFGAIQSKHLLDPSTSLKVLWLVLAVMLSISIPWENYISPRDEEDEEYEDMEREPINA